MEVQLRELLPFLHDKNPQVRQIALSHLLVQTPKDSPHRSIFFEGAQSGGLRRSKEADVIRDLKLLCRDQATIAHDAFRALVNLSDSSVLAAALSEPTFLVYVVSYIIEPSSVMADLAAMLLSNLSASPSACSSLISLKMNIIVDPRLPNGFYAPQSRCGTVVLPNPLPSGEPQEILALPLLLDAFVQGASPISDLSRRPRKADLHFLASVFANATTTSPGRDFFFTPRLSNLVDIRSELEYPLTKIVTFTEHENVIRRGGAISTIRNCCFHTAGHPAILTPGSTPVSVPPSNIQASGIGALTYILLPLAGPEEFDLEDQEKLPEVLQFLPPDKKREVDSVLRLSLVESLLLLCSTRWCRDFQRDNGVYEIIRAAHLVETEEKISEHMERLVVLLKGDEPEDEEQHASIEKVESDDEDNRIEEV